MTDAVVAAYVALGANLDDPATQVERTFEDIDRVPGVRLLARSSLYRSAPVGYDDQPDFVNAVACVETRLEPGPLLAALLDVERTRGRRRSFRNAPRTIDLDLLLYGERSVDEAHLRVPHPRMHERAFVLVPLAEIAPDCVIPGLGRVSALLAGVAGQRLERIERPAPGARAARG